jgi:hypothetical protein
MKRAFGLILFLLVLPAFGTCAYAISPDENITENSSTFEEIFALLISLLCLAAITIVVLIFNIRNRAKTINTLESNISDCKAMHERAMKELDDEYRARHIEISTEQEELRHTLDGLIAYYNLLCDIYPGANMEVSKIAQMINMEKRLLPAKNNIKKSAVT